MSFSIACCATLNLLLDNDVKDIWGEYYEGVYKFQGFSDGMDYWVDADGKNAIWYLKSWWRIGSLSNLGSTTCKITSYNLGMTCPNNEGIVFSWQFYDSSWTITNDVYLKCANEDDFCTSENPCSIDQGDCDIHDECQDGLVCGSNNCPDSLGFHSEFDCCYNATVGDEHFCTIENPCGEGQGDCDFSNECLTNLTCDIANSCPDYLGFNSEVDCCSSSILGCKFHEIESE